LTVSGIQVSEAPRKSLEVTSLGSSEKIFRTSNLYRLCIQLAKRAVKGMQAYSGEYSFTLGLTVDSSFTARLPTQIHFSPRLSLSLYLSIYLSLSLSRRRPHRSPLSTTTPPPPYSLAAGDRAPRASRVRGRAPFVVGGSQLQRKEEEPFVGVDLDLP
jgi:hypothetical protein